MRELIRLLYLVVVVLPLALFLIGPLLVLAALRGVQRVGPIIFDPGRRGLGGRVTALLLGLLLWLTVWGGLVLLLVWAVLSSTPAGYQAEVAAVMPTASSTLVPTFTPSAQPVPALTSGPPTGTIAPSPTPQPPASPTPTQVSAGDTPSPPPSPTPSPVPPTPTSAPPTATPTSAAPPSPTLTPAATLSPGQAAQAIATVEKANELLRAAVVEPSIGNLAALETAWRGRALADAQAFAQDLYRRYLRPLEVTFVYLAPPVALEGSSSDKAIVSSTEAWTYSGLRTSRSESFEFTYTLTRQDESWVITDYAYRRVSVEYTQVAGPGISPTVSTSVIVTTTAVITP